MKKIFWTSVFRIAIVILFRTYMKLFNGQLGTKVADLFFPAQAVTTNSGIVLTGTGIVTATESKLDLLVQQINLLPAQIDQRKTSQTQASSQMYVKLYYFNQTEDQKLPIEQQLNVSSLLPVLRPIISSDPLKDTLNLLLQGSLTAQEKMQGFMTEFPHQNFTLKDMNLALDGTLTLTFPEIPGFTDGGSARMWIMSNSIIKTAMQFPEVKKVVFMPETLFQP